MRGAARGQEDACAPGQLEHLAAAVGDQPGGPFEQQQRREAVGAADAEAALHLQQLGGEEFAGSQRAHAAAGQRGDLTDRAVGHGGGVGDGDVGGLIHVQRAGLAVRAEAADTR